MKTSASPALAALPPSPPPDPRLEAPARSSAAGLFSRRVAGCAVPAVLAASALLLSAPTGRAEIVVTVDHAEGEQDKPAFHFKTVRNALDNQFSTSLSTSLLEGEQDGNSGAPDVLFDGKSPDQEDQPDQNFFFKDGGDGGRLLVTLGETTPIQEIDTYSWHPDTRAPQVYKLYASDGSGAGFVAEPKRPQDPATCGWKMIASVDTRKKFGNAGGQYGVSIKDSSAPLGSYRYLLFDVSRTEENDSFGNTFYSEVNVIDANAPDKPGTMAAAGASTPGKATVTINVNGKQETHELDLGKLGRNMSKSIVSASVFAFPVKMVPTVWLGVGCEEVPDDLRKALPLTPGTGLVIHSLSDGSPASKSGLKEQDILTKLGDQLLVNPRQLQALVKGKHDGETVHLSYLRHGQESAVDIQLATHDAPAGADSMDAGGLDLGSLPHLDNSFTIQDKAIVLDKNGKVLRGMGTLNLSGSEPIGQKLEELDGFLRKQGLDDEAIKKIKQDVAARAKEIHLRSGGKEDGKAKPKDGN